MCACAFACASAFASASASACVHVRVSACGRMWLRICVCVHAWFRIRIVFPMQFPMCVDNLQLPQRSPNGIAALMQRSIRGRGWSASSCCAMVTCVVEVSSTTSGLSQRLTACTYGVIDCTLNNTHAPRIIGNLYIVSNVRVDCRN